MFNKLDLISEILPSLPGNQISQLPPRIRDEWPKVVGTPTKICPITVSERPPNDYYYKEYTELKWEPTHIIDFKK